MLTGHASHQVGLDADIWLTPMPDRRLSEKEREELSATSMLAADGVSVDPRVWTRRMRSSSAAPRPTRRSSACSCTRQSRRRCARRKDGDRSVLHKIRPYWGHHYHMHIRIACPKGSDNCEGQPSAAIRRRMRQGAGRLDGA